jgi:glutathione S-transferase
MAPIIVHGIPGSPYVRMPLLACEEKGAPYQIAAMQFGQNKTPDYLARHPFGRIPVIEHDGFWLYEAAAIIRYIDQVFPGPSLTPADPKAQARMNQVMGIVDWYVMPTISSGIGWNRIVAPMIGRPVDEEAVAKAVPGATTCVRALEQLLGTQPYMAGNTISLADLMLIAHLELLPASPEGAKIMKDSPLLAWIARMQARPSVQATETRKLMAAAAAAS